MLTASTYAASATRWATSDEHSRISPRERSSGGADSWGEVAILRASDAQRGDHFGYSVAVSGDTVVVGAPFENGGPGSPMGDAGAAYVFYGAPVPVELLSFSVE